MDDKKFCETKYKNHFIKENYDRINLTMPKGNKEIIKRAAIAAGESVNEYINQAISERLEKEEA